MTNNILNDEKFKQTYPILLVPYNSKWNIWYIEEENTINKLLNGIEFNSYHIGSTSICGIYSKNIIDILIEILFEEDFNSAISKLEANYSLRWNEGVRAFLVKGYDKTGFADRVFHIHVRKKGDIDEVYFRDYLRNNEKVAKSYEILKLTSAENYKNDREGYTNSKTEFIRKYTEQAKRK